MQLEVGKSYKTRDGRKAKVLAAREGVFMGCSDGYLGIQIWKASGQSMNGFLIIDKWDIIEEWSEPVVLEAWINVYHSAKYYVPMYLHSSRESAHNSCKQEDGGESLRIKVDLSKPKGQRIWEEV